MASPQRLSEPILRGQLQDLDVGSLLSALRLGRQYLTLEVYDSVGDCTGVVAVKAGRIISASVDGYTGTEAVRHLLQSRDAAEFRVLPQPMAAEELVAEPLGTIDAITQAISESEEHSHSTRTPVLRGVVSEQLSLEEVLRSLAFSRQHLTLALSDAEGNALGEVAVKANKVLSARAGDVLGLPALRELLDAASGSNFALFTENQSVEQLHPLGTVADVLNNITEDRSSDEAPIAVMDGKLGELDVASILQVTGASRQYTCLHIFDDQRQALGTIHLKSGRVVRAQAQDVTGVAAVRRLLHCPRDFSFLVQRYPHATEATELTSSIGSIADVLARAAEKPAAASIARVQHGKSSKAKRRAAERSTWLGALLGASFVLLGGIATALLMRSPAPTAPALPTTTTLSPVAVPPQQPAEIVAHPAPAPEQPTPPDTTRIDAPKAPAPADSFTTLSRANVASLQAGLHQLGYDTGPIDGIVGQRTAAAIKAFQYAEHLSADGTLSAATRAVLLRRMDEP